jgi:hypothetical protein
LLDLLSRQTKGKQGCGVIKQLFKGIAYMSSLAGPSVSNATGKVVSISK